MADGTGKHDGKRQCVAGAAGGWQSLLGGYRLSHLCRHCRHLAGGGSDGSMWSVGGMPRCADSVLSSIFNVLTDCCLQ